MTQAEGLLLISATSALRGPMHEAGVGTILQAQGVLAKGPRADRDSLAKLSQAVWVASARAAGGLQRLWQSREGQGGDLLPPRGSSCTVTRVFAQGSHKVFWNCGEAQAEVSSDPGLASRPAKGQGLQPDGGKGHF